LLTQSCKPLHYWYRGQSKIVWFSIFMYRKRVKSDVNLVFGKLVKKWFYTDLTRSNLLNCVNLYEFICICEFTFKGSIFFFFAHMSKQTTFRKNFIQPHVSFSPPRRQIKSENTFSFYKKKTYNLLILDCYLNVYIIWWDNNYVFYTAI
jgi:hypothetical protein